MAGARFVLLSREIFSCLSVHIHLLTSSSPPFLFQMSLFFFSASYYPDIRRDPHVYLRTQGCACGDSASVGLVSIHSGKEKKELEISHACTGKYTHIPVDLHT